MGRGEGVFLKYSFVLVGIPFHLPQVSVTCKTHPLFETQTGLHYSMASCVIFVSIFSFLLLTKLQ